MTEIEQSYPKITTHVLQEMKLKQEKIAMLTAYDYPTARLADEAARRIETMDGVEDVSRPQATGRREIQVSIDRDRVAELGRSAADITQMLAFSLGGVRLDRFDGDVIGPA